MEDGEREKIPTKREITYQIGWKKGRMEFGENGKVKKAKVSSTDTVFLNPAVWMRFMERTAWRPIPIGPDSFILGLLWSIPAVAFLMIWLLVYYLGK